MRPFLQEEQMKFSIGYPLNSHGKSFFEMVSPLMDHVAEIYFAWPGESSGRSAAGHNFGMIDYGATEELLDELFQFRNAGVKLALLFNGNCYGEDAMSKALEGRVLSVLEYMDRTVGIPETVTTASPAIGYIIKKHCPEIKTRASVNMRIGTIQGLEYVSDRFDEYVLQRDYNRDLDHMKELVEWCKANGKGSSILVNSGCLRFCSAQTFHDNLVAHGSGVDMRYPIEGFSLNTCWNHLKKSDENKLAMLQSTWIRPEDLHHYYDLFDTVKLATRMHPAPYMVLEAYAKRRFTGNLLDLFEPGFASIIAPHILDNSAFSPDWFEKVLKCQGKCWKCSVCREEWNKVFR